MPTKQELDAYIDESHAKMGSQHLSLGKGLQTRMAMTPETASLQELQTADVYLASLHAKMMQSGTQLGEAMVQRGPMDYVIPPPPSDPKLWPDPKLFDDGSVEGNHLAAGLELYPLAGGYWKPDATYVDLQGHVDHHYDGTVWAETFRKMFLRGELRIAPAQVTHLAPFGGKHLAGTRWERGYDADGLVFEDCVFFRLGKWEQAATEGHGLYVNAHGDVTIRRCIFYEDGGNGLQVDFRGGCSDPSKGWYPETKMTQPAEFVSSHTKLLGRGLPTKTIILDTVAAIECGKIRSGAPFKVGDSRDGFDFTFFAPGQAVECNDLLGVEVQGTPFTDSTKGECRSSIGFLHHDVRGCYPRSAPRVNIDRMKLEGFLNDRSAMVLIGHCDEHTAKGIELIDRGGREVVYAILNNVKHASVEFIGAGKVTLELRDAKDPHRSSGIRKIMSGGDTWVGDPSSMSLGTVTPH